METVQQLPVGKLAKVLPSVCMRVSFINPSARRLLGLGAFPSAANNKKSGGGVLFRSLRPLLPGWGGRETVSGAWVWGAGGSLLRSWSCCCCRRGCSARSHADLLSSAGSIAAHARSPHEQLLRPGWAQIARGEPPSLFGRQKAA